MENYLYYTPEEFAQDDLFIRWVKEADLETEKFWQGWLETYPFKRADVEAARQLILVSLQLPGAPLTPSEAAEMKRKVFSGISDRERRKLSDPVFFRRYYAAAASVLLLLLAGWYWNSQKPDAGAPSESTPFLTDKASTIFRNNENAPRWIELPDGSSVILGEGSLISLPVAYGEKTRDVYLTGEAFFEVVKNPAVPFLVHAQEIVTKVLGTSFHVRAFPDQSDTRVLVKTGKVSVYDLRKSARQGIAGPADLVLEADQEGVYDKKAAALRFLPRADRESQLLPPIMEILFEYDETPVGRVFEDLEKAYHVGIIYDKEAISNCPVTASFGDEPFHEKLRLICIAIGAKYEIINGEIMVTGKGCS